MKLNLNQKLILLVLYASKKPIKGLLHLEAMVFLVKKALTKEELERIEKIEIEVVEG